MEDGIGEVIPMFFESCLIMVFSVIVSLNLGLKLAGVGVLCLAVCILTLYFSTFFVTDQAAKELEASTSAGIAAEETLTLIKTVKAYNGQNIEIQRYKNCLSIAKNLNFKKNIILALSFGFTWFITYFMVAALLYCHSIFLLDTKFKYIITVPNILSIIWTLYCAGFQFSYLIMSLETISNACGAAKAVFNLLGSNSNNQNFYDSDKLEINGNIFFQNVCFTYPTNKELLVCIS